MVTPNEKFCKRCASVRNASDFYVSIAKKDGLSFYCKSCTLKMNAATKKKPGYKPRVKLTPEEKARRINAAKRRWDASNKEKVLAYKRNWAAKNPRYVYRPDRRQERPDKQAERDIISDAYICSQILYMKASEVPKELIEAKRIQIKIRRLIRNGNQ